MNTIRYWIALRQLPYLLRQQIYGLVNQQIAIADLFTEPQAFLSTPTQAAAFERIEWSWVDEELAWQAQTHQQRLCYTDPDYPELLKHIDDPPPILYLEGQLTSLSLPMIAIVGSRHPSHSGKQTAFHLAKTLAQAGLCIVSGLAYGVDAASHRGALAAQGTTLAILGTGLNSCYPKTHAALAHDITQTGALISEWPPHTPPCASNFPKRNRIITGLSHALVVVEAGLASGSLVSARLANEQGRTVMAVPGSIYHPQTQGCHQLIKQGAVLVENTADILAELPFNLEQKSQSPPRKTSHPLAKTDLDMVQYLSVEPLSVDDLAHISGQPVACVQAVLMLLVLSGHVVETACGYALAQSLS